MQMQKQLTTSMRGVLVDWLVEVQESFELYHETLYVGVKILDNFLMRYPVEREDLQLVGAASLFISCKVEVSLKVSSSLNYVKSIALSLIGFINFLLCFILQGETFPLPG